MFHKNNPAKEQIIDILVDNRPLSITELRRLGTFKHSYQYTRQALNELVNEGMVVRKGVKYELSLLWIKKVHDFTDKVIANYKYGTQNKLLPVKATYVTVHSLEELGNFMLDALECRFLEKKDQRGFYGLLHHLWIPFINREKQRRLLALTEPIQVIYTKKTILDQLLYRACYKPHVQKICFVNQEIDYDLFVYNQATFQIYFPQELLKLMDRLYSVSANPFRKIVDLFEMTYKQFSISIVVTRNKDIANQHRQKIRDLFQR